MRRTSTCGAGSISRTAAALVEESAERLPRLAQLAGRPLEFQRLRLPCGDESLDGGERQRLGSCSPSPAKLRAHLTLERIFPIGFEKTGWDERSLVYPCRTRCELRDRVASDFEESLPAPDAQKRDGNVVGPLRPGLAETTQRRLRDFPKAHRRVHQDMIDASPVPRFE